MFLKKDFDQLSILFLPHRSHFYRNDQCERKGEYNYYYNKSIILAAF